MSRVCADPGGGRSASQSSVDVKRSGLAPRAWVRGWVRGCVRGCRRVGQCPTGHTPSLQTCSRAAAARHFHSTVRNEAMAPTAAAVPVRLHVSGLPRDNIAGSELRARFAPFGAVTDVQAGAYTRPLFSST